LIATSVDFIGLCDWHLRLSKSGSPQRRTCLPAGREIAKGDFSFDPIGPSLRRSGFGRAGGRRRLDQKPIPSGRRSKPLDGYGTYYEARIERTETFLFGGISRQTKNAFSASSARSKFYFGQACLILESFRAIVAHRIPSQHTHTFQFT